MNTLEKITMSNLIDAYNNMLESRAVEAEEATKEAEATQERVEVLAKYAEAADNLLSEEYGEDYNEEDVEKLAKLMINYDIEQEEAMSKVAEFEQAGQIMAHAFAQELDRISNEDDSDNETEEK
jgi:CHASE1-domain containing sensor protein